MARKSAKKGEAEERAAAASQSQPARPTRKAHAQAMQNAVWLDAGCPKGPGAKAAAEQRKRALSNIEEPATVKKSRTDNKTIPEPTFDDDSDIEMNFVTRTQQVEPTPKKTSRAFNAKKTPNSAVTPISRTNATTQVSRTSGYVPPPASLDDSSSEDEADKKSDVEDQDEEGADSDDQELTEQQFLSEQAMIPSNNEEDISDTLNPSDRPAQRATKERTVQEPTLRKPVKQKNAAEKKSNKRAELYAKEKPIITDVEDIKVLKTCVWSKAATPVRSEKGDYNKLQQPEVLQSIIEQTFLEVIEHGITSTMYPSYAKPAVFTRNFFMKAAVVVGNSMVDKEKKAQAKENFTRFRDDPRFVQCFAGMVMNRFSLFRTAALTIACLNSAAHLGIFGMSRDDAKAAASNELDNDLYLFKRKKNGTKLQSSPYLHACIKELIREWIFGQGESSTGVKLSSKFPLVPSEYSDDTDGPQQEMTIPIVAAAATVIYAGLERMQTNGTMTGTPFRTGAFATVYGIHVETLESMAEVDPWNYHQIMAELYRFASNQEVQVKKQLIAFDFDDRDDDSDEEEWLGTCHWDEPAESVATTTGTGKAAGNAEGEADAGAGDTVADEEEMDLHNNSEQ